MHKLVAVANALWFFGLIGQDSQAWSRKHGLRFWWDANFLITNGDQGEHVFGALSVFIGFFARSLFHTKRHADSDYSNGGFRHPTSQYPGRLK